MSDPQGFRAQFPVFERTSYLNAGTEGPLPRQAAEAVRERMDLEVREGRVGKPYLDRVMEMAAELRAGYARVLGCEAAEVALTGSTTDGVNTIIAGLDLRRGEEILTSDEEHPGLLAPLGRAQARLGVKVRTVPFGELPGEVTPATRLIACSHVSWVGGKVMDVAGLRDSGVPILLDGAQALGAVPVDVRELGCDFYAGSGQKWLCGPEGSGCLYVRAERLEDLLVPWPGYGSLADPERALEFPPKPDAERLDHGFPVGLRSAWALASLAVLEQAGLSWLHERASRLGADLAQRLSERGLEVEARGRSTLVSYRVGDPDAELERLLAQEIVVRSIPGRDLIRVSTGAWSSEEELERLVELAAR